MIMADSGRAVADSGRVVFFDIWGNGLLSIKNILAMLQSDETIRQNFLNLPPFASKSVN